MTNSICCPRCGMLRTSCTCSKSSKDRNKSKSFNKKENKFSKNKKGNRIHYKIKSNSKDKTTSKNKTIPKFKRIEKELNSKIGFNGENIKKTHVDNLKKTYSHIDSKIIENFPFESPRKDQFEIISKISDAISDGYKYIVLEAGTGTGKSVIAATLAKIYSPAFILTMTKQLQDQYLADFEKEGFCLVKGRNNFDCKEKEIYSGEKGIGCDNGTCTERYNFNCMYKFRPVDSDIKTNLKPAFRNMYWKSDIHCNFLEQKVEGINSDVVIANYAYGLLELNYAGDFVKRKLLILDEAHNLERKIMRFIELEIDRKRLESEVKIKVTDYEIENLHNIGHESWISFINNIIRRYEKEYIKYEAELKESSGNKKIDHERALKELAIELDKYERFISYIENDSGN